MREDQGKGKRRGLHSRTRKGWASILVILLVGIVVKTADAKSPRWECITAFFCIRERHPMLFFHKLPVKALGGFFFLPTHLGSWGSGSSVKNDLLAVREFCPTGGSNPASVKDWAHLLTASKQRSRPSTSPETMVSATAGCLWRTIFRQSAQLAQWAPSLILVALVSPETPWKNGNEAVTSADHPP